MQALNKNSDIFIYGHKPFIPLVTNNIYKVLTNTKENIPTSLPVYRDYEGDNIGDKNLMYNEYTGFYWLWKNYDIKNYIGLIGYRRYYSFYDDVPDFNKVFSKHSIVISDPLQLILNDKQVNNRDYYEFWHNVEDFDLLEQMFHEQYPEYTKAFEKMKNSNYIYNSSMFVMRRDNFKDYCEYIFDVLDCYNDYMGLHSVEEYKDHVAKNQNKYIKPHLPYYNIDMQARIIGYIAERALMTWLIGENLEKKAKTYTWNTI